MKKLILKLLILFLPLEILIIYFISFDPMKIIHNTDNPVSSGVLMNDRLYQARYLSKTNIKYDAFIFGSSRSKAFKAYEWKKIIKKNITPYHMGVNDETLYGIERKINYLNNLNFRINEVLLVLDNRILSLTKNHDAHIFREYYTLTGETPASFYQRFTIAFLNFSFLNEYIYFLLNYKIRNQSQNNYMWDPGFLFIKQTGDIIYQRIENEIKYDSIKYYKKINLENYKRFCYEDKIAINYDAIVLLKNISMIFKQNKSNYKIILSPNFDQKKVSKYDIYVLQSIFGENNVYDFSGCNEFTSNIGNYYEHKHFKPYVANRIMKILYCNE